MMTNMRYTALALQTACHAVNGDPTPNAAHERMRASIARVEKEILAAKAFLKGFNGYDLKLVVLPEYWMTAFPMGESRAEWQAKAAIGMDGAFADRLSTMAQKCALFICSNHYETDAYFPELYFQSNVIYAPSGNVVLRYRRMISLYAPSPYDVWTRYLDVYGEDAVFPVAKTELGTLGTIASEEILYPEIARMTIFKGAEILLHPTSEVSSPLMTPKHVCKRARAIENMAFVISANSGGIFDSNIPANSTDGMSCIIDPYGRTLAEAAMGQSINANALIDLGALRSARLKTGMTNTLSRLPNKAFAPAYARAHHADADRTPDGRMMDRAGVLNAQQSVINRLEASGTLTKEQTDG
jgi:predicted amidohydrolase